MLAFFSLFFFRWDGGGGDDSGREVVVEGECGGEGGRVRGGRQGKQGTMVKMCHALCTANKRGNVRACMCPRFIFIFIF